VVDVDVADAEPTEAQLGQVEGDTVFEAVLSQPVRGPAFKGAWRGAQQRRSAVTQERSNAGGCAGIRFPAAGSFWATGSPWS